MKKNYEQKILLDIASLNFVFKFGPYFICISKAVSNERAEAELNGLNL